MWFGQAMAHTATFEWIVRVHITVAGGAAIVLHWLTDFTSLYFRSYLLVVVAIYLILDLLSLILEIPRRISRVKIFDQTSQLWGVVRLSDVHRVICTDIVLLVMDFAPATLALAHILIHAVVPCRIKLR